MQGHIDKTGAIPPPSHSFNLHHLPLHPNPISTASILTIRCFPNSTHAVYNGILAVLLLLLITLNTYNYEYTLCSRAYYREW